MTRTSLLAVLALVACGGTTRTTHAPTTAATTTQTTDEILPITVEQGRFVIYKTDGSVATDAELTGAMLVAQTGDGLQSVVRIDALIADPQLPSRTLYKLSRREADGSWATLCDAGPDGLSAGFPVPGRWTDSGEHLDAPGEFEITCTSGAIGKCVRFGYSPWQSPAMWDLHQACTRMVRADYCGTGKPHTKNGMRIDLYDQVGIQLDEPDPGMTFEAGWSKDGAVCVNHTRVREIATLDDIAAECGAKLAGRLGNACTEEVARREPKLQILNKSL